jgi:hypothetical protein
MFPGPPRTRIRRASHRIRSQSVVDLDGLGVEILPFVGGFAWGAHVDKGKNLFIMSFVPRLRCDVDERERARTRSWSASASGARKKATAIAAEDVMDLILESRTVGVSRSRD